MDFNLSEEQGAIKEMARDFSRNEFLPYAREWDSASFFPEKALRNAAALGFGGIYVGEDVGGSALTRLDSAIIIEELGAGCPSTAAFLSIHNMAAWMIDSYGNSEQRNRFLPKLCTMEHFASYCLTEPNAGSDAASLTTKAVRVGDEYILNGTKAFISGGGRSDVYVVMARTGEAGAKGISTFIVERGLKGLSFGAQEKKLGWKSQPTSMVIFDDCRVSAKNRLAEEGDGFKIAMAGLDGGRINIGACSLGGASYALEITKEHLKTRKQFGKSLASFQALQFRLADHLTHLEAARLLLHKAALAVTHKTSDATPLAAMAKRFATDTGFEIVNDCLQMHGGYGYLNDYPLERILRDLRVHQILEGTNEIMRLIISREALA